LSCNKRIAVLVSGGGTNLQAIIDAVDSGKITGGEISMVLSSSPDAYALTRAEKKSIPTVVVDRKAYSTREEYSEAVSNILCDHNPDLIVLAGFMYILSEKVISHFVNRIINVHPALIPSFCGEGYYGLRVHKAALAKGVKVTGATVHFVNEIADGGPIILQKAVPIKEGDTPEILQKRVMEEAEWIIFPEAVNLFCNDKLSVEEGIVHISE